jgi:hypothetical protein
MIDSFASDEEHAGMRETAGGNNSGAVARCRQESSGEIAELRDTGRVDT